MEIPGQEDALLVAEILKGRKASFTTLVNRYQPLVRLGIWSYFRKQEIVDDLSQDTFIKIYYNLSSLKDPKKIKGWILQIAFHVCVDYQRRNKIENVQLEQKAIDDLQNKTNNEGTSFFDEKTVLNLLNRLSPVDCFIVWLKYVEEMPYSEIAGMIDSTEAGIRQKTSRAMKALREYLK